MARSEEFNEMVENYKELVKVNLLPIRIRATMFNDITMPLVPTNLQLMLTDIEYPDKAKVKDGEGINGALYNKPIKDICKKAADNGIYVFTDKTIGEFTIPIKEQYEIELDKYKHLTRNSYIQSLLEVGDIGQPGTSPTIPVKVDHTPTEDLRSKGVLMLTSNNRTLSLKMVDAAYAIDKVISSAVNGISDLCESIGISAENRAKIGKEVLNEADAAVKNIEAWFGEHNDVLKSSKESAREKLELQSQILSNIIEFQLQLITNEHPDWELVTPMTDIQKRDFSHIFNKYKQPSTKDSKNTLINDLSAKGLIRRKHQPTGTQHTFISTLHINEADENTSEKNVEVSLDFDKIYATILGTLKPLCYSMSQTDANNWEVIKVARKQMEELKKRADEEIMAKIDLICRTASSGNADIGDKFKSALSKHPVRAEGLKSLWKRYSLDLDERVEQRLRHILKSDAVVFAKSYLSETFPVIMAVLITYKCLIYTIAKEYQEYIDIPSDEELLQQAMQYIQNDLDLLIVNLQLIYISNNTQN